MVGDRIFTDWSGGSRRSKKACPPGGLEKCWGVQAGTGGLGEDTRVRIAVDLQFGDALIKAHCCVGK